MMKTLTGIFVGAIFAIAVHFMLTTCGIDGWVNGWFCGLVYMGVVDITRIILKALEHANNL